MEDLCRQLAQDLDGAFPEMVRVLRDDVYSGLRRTYGHEADDLAQETFIRAYKALRKYSPDRIENLKLRGWIWTIALNLGRNHARDRARRPTPVEIDDRDGFEDPDPIDGAAWEKRLSQLPDAQRQAVVLRHVVGLSYEEMSAATGRPEGTAKSDVHRGLQRLKEIMEDEQ